MSKKLKKLICYSMVGILLLHNCFYASNVIVANNPSGTGKSNSSSTKVSPRIYTVDITNTTQNRDAVTGPGVNLQGNAEVSKGPQIDSNNNGGIITGVPSPGASGFSNNTSAQTNTQTNNTTTTNQNIINTVSFNKYTPNVAGAPSITSDAAILVNLTTNQIYVSKNENVLLAPASLANLVTAYILVNSTNLNDVVKVSASAVTNLEDKAFNIGLKANDTITVKDLLHSMLIKSACDSANVIAEKVAGSVPVFVALMNSTVKSWGCNSTNFENPSGLNGTYQYTTAYDMAIILSKILENQTIIDILGKTTYTLSKTITRKAMTIESNFKTKNKSSSFYDANCIFGKQGYTSKALYTLGSVYKYKNNNIAVVILRSQGDHYNLSKSLYNYAKKVIDADASANANAVNTAGTWKQDSNGWYYVKSNGQKAVNEWITYNNEKYCVDSNGYMISGWQEFSDGNLYYFDLQNGALKYNTWVNTQTGAYYLTASGALAKAAKGQTMVIDTQAGKYIIDENGKAIAKG